MSDDVLLDLRFNQSLSYTEIAEALEIPVGTVRSRLHNAIALIRELFVNTKLNFTTCTNQNDVGGAIAVSQDVSTFSCSFNGSLVVVRQALARHCKDRRTLTIFKCNLVCTGRLVTITRTEDK